MRIGGPVTALRETGVFLTMFHKCVLFLSLAVCVAGTLALAPGYRALPWTF